MNAQRLRANAQQMATNRLHSNSAGNANPSTGMYLELAGSKFPENAAIIVTCCCKATGYKLQSYELRVPFGMIAQPLVARSL